MKKYLVDESEFYTFKPSFSSFDFESVVFCSLVGFFIVFALYIYLFPFN